MQSTGGGHDQPEARLAAEPGHGPPDRLVRGDAARGDDRLAGADPLLEQPEREAQAVDDRVDHGGLEGGAEVGDIRRRQGRDPVGLHPHRGLQAGQREVRFRPAQHRTRKGEALGIAVERALFDQRAAGIGQSQHLGDLVEGFADRVVERRAEPDVVADSLHRDELGVAARQQEQEIGEGGIVGEARGQRMGLEMIDGNEGFAQGERDGLAGRQADDDAADEAGTGRRRDGIDLGDRHAGLGDGAFDEPVQHLDMGAGRDLGHDPAVGPRAA